MRQIRNSAKALIIRDGKVLAAKIKDAEGEWYILPGGGQEPEELLSEAVVREVAEETGLAVHCGELLFVVEGLHGESFHRVDLAFNCKYIGEIQGAELHTDTNRIGYDWLDIETLNTQPLYPSKMKQQIMNYYEGKPHEGYLGDESSGDAWSRYNKMRNRSMALVVRNNTILMVKQKVLGREFYIIPGGGIEEGETPEQAALRELKEECGFDGTIIKHLTTNYRSNGNTEYVYWVNVEEGQDGFIGSDPEYDEHEQIIVGVKWMKLNELSEKDRAFLWSYGLIDVYGFEKEVISWGDTVSYPD